MVQTFSGSTGLGHAKACLSLAASLTKFAVASAVLLLSPVAHVAQGTLIIALSGDAAPDGNGTFSGFHFYQPVLNDTGQVAFRADLAGTSGGTSDDVGIFRGAGDAITQIARERSAGAVTSGLQLRPLSFPALNKAGQVAFMATIRQPLFAGGAELDGVFRGSGGLLTQIALEGNAAPDGNGTYFDFSNTQPALNDAGQCAFKVYLDGTIGGTSDDEGIFRGSGGAITQIARAGQAAPDGNGTYSFFTSHPALNEVGQVAFSARLTGTSGGGFVDDDGVFRGSGGAITQIARAPQAAPDGNGTYRIFYSPALNDAGQVSFSAGLEDTSGGTNDNEGIFRSAAGAITQIVRAGQPAPDGNGTFSDYIFNNQSLNNLGQVAFDDWLIGTSSGFSDDEGIFLNTGGSIVQIAGEGQAAPDGNGTFGWFDDAGALNHDGEVAFFAALGGTSGGTSDDHGIFLNNGSEILQVVREGQVLAGSVITSLYPIATGRDYLGDERSGLNELGQIAFVASLANGKEVIALWTPPAIVGDYNGDGVVDAADYVVWRKNEYTTNMLPNDPLGGTIDQDQFNQWRARYGQIATSGGADSGQSGVPEPKSLLLLLIGGILTPIAAGSGRQRSRTWRLNLCT